MSPAMSNLRHLYAFRAVVETGSVSAAARAMHLSQPAITQAVAALEREFSTRLFGRTSRGMAPTEAGRVCAERVTRVLERIDDAVRSANPNVRGTRNTTHGITAGQLHALLVVIEAGGFGPAARAVGTTRATLHRAARELARRIGVPLFEATSHGLRATREALRLALQVQLAMAELAQARAELASLSGAERGETVIGAMPLARSRMVPEAILRFVARRPYHRVSILDGPYESLLDALRRGRADVLVGALRDAVPADLVQEFLFGDPLAIIVRRGHPLEKITHGGRRPPPLEALSEFAWIAPRQGSPLRRHFVRLLRSATGLAPAAPIECNSLIAARALLLASDRAMLLSSQQAQHELAAGEFVALPHPAGQVVREIGLTLRKDWRPTIAQADLLDTLRDVARSSATIDARTQEPKRISAQ
jgi:LysR family transcriptional regulator, regulator for genes of the gallate degradation pathway